MSTVTLEEVLLAARGSSDHAANLPRGPGLDPDSPEGLCRVTQTDLEEAA